MRIGSGVGSSSTSASAGGGGGLSRSCHCWTILSVCASHLRKTASSPFYTSFLDMSKFHGGLFGQVKTSRDGSTSSSRKMDASFGMGLCRTRDEAKDNACCKKDVGSFTKADCNFFDDSPAAVGTDRVRCPFFFWVLVGFGGGSRSPRLIALRSFCSSFFFRAELGLRRCIG